MATKRTEAEAILEVIGPKTLADKIAYLWSNIRTIEWILMTGTGIRTAQDRKEQEDLLTHECQALAALGVDC